MVSFLVTVTFSSLHSATLHPVKKLFLKEAIMEQIQITKECSIMRQKKPYSLFKRQVNGRTIYYVHLYFDGKKLSKSTGQTTEEAARQYVMSLLCSPAAYNHLLSSNYLSAYEKHLSCHPKALGYPIDHIVFRDYAKNWWLWDKCRYVRIKRNAGTANKPGIRQWTVRYIIPAFADLELGQITPARVDDFLMDLSRKLSPKTVNNIRSAFSVMMEQAVLNRMISFNPVKGSTPMVVEAKESILLTDEECEELFNIDRIEEL